MGLVKWKDGQGLPPTWKNLVDAMQFAQIAKSHVTELKKKLGLSQRCMYVHVYSIHVCTQVHMYILFAINGVI